LKDLGIDGTIILKLIFEKWDTEAWTGLMWLRMGRAGACECGNEPLVPIKYWEFLD
jgi:hypothetical protein